MELNNTAESEKIHNSIGTTKTKYFVNICIIFACLVLVSSVIITFTMGTYYAVQYQEMKSDYIHDKMGYCNVLNKTINAPEKSYWTVEVSPTPIFDKQCFVDSWPIITKIYFNRNIDNYKDTVVYPCWYDLNNHYSVKWTKFDIDEL